MAEIMLESGFGGLTVFLAEGDMTREELGDGLSYQIFRKWRLSPSVPKCKARLNAEHGPDNDISCCKRQQLHKERQGKGKGKGNVKGNGRGSAIDCVTIEAPGVSHEYLNGQYVGQGYEEIR